MSTLCGCRDDCWLAAVGNPGVIHSNRPTVSAGGRHRSTSTNSMCGTLRCEAGRGHCQQMPAGPPLCVCVEGYYGPDCQQRTYIRNSPSDHRCFTFAQVHSVLSILSSN